MSIITKTNSFHLIHIPVIILTILTIIIFIIFIVVIIYRPFFILVHLIYVTISFNRLLIFQYLEVIQYQAILIFESKLPIIKAMEKHMKHEWMDITCIVNITKNDDDTPRRPLHHSSPLKPTVQTAHAPDST